jgi:hypothetical protein
MIEQIAALKVGPDELLVLKVPDATWEEVDEMARMIEKTPFKNRVLIVTEADIEFAVVAK